MSTLARAAQAVVNVLWRAGGVVGSVHPRDPVLADWFGGGSSTASGATVTPDSAMRTSAVYACVRVLAETIAALPLMVWRRTDLGKERAPEHPLYDILHNAPNARQTSFEWREMQVGHVALRGDAYSEIVYTNDNRIAALLPLHPDRVQPFAAANNTIAFRHQPLDGPSRVLMDHEVLRFPGMTSDSIRSLSPINLHRETIGLAVASRQYLARFYANNAAPKGGIKVPAALDDAAAKLLRESWERRHKGFENAHRLAILDGGMEWQQIGISNEDAQYLELMGFNAADIARIYRVPPHKIGILDKATFSNIEHQAIEFVIDTIVPWVVRIEARLNRSLLSPADRRLYVVGFELKGLLRGDATARGNFYKAMFGMGALSPNGALALEDMNGFEGGDERYIPLNMAPVGRLMDVLLKSAPAPARSMPNGHDREDDDHASQ